MGSSSGHIYGLSLPGDRIRYVGLTTIGVSERLLTHRRNARSGVDYPVYRWMRKHGDLVEATTLERHDGDLATLGEREVYWIAELGTHVSAGGLNCTVGGDGRMGAILSDSTKALISASKRASPPVLSAETIRLLSAAGKRRSRATLEAQRERQTGSHRSPQTVALMMRGHHTRWHVNRGLRSPTCAYC